MFCRSIASKLKCTAGLTAVIKYRSTYTKRNLVYTADPCLSCSIRGIQPNTLGTILASFAMVFSCFVHIDKAE